MPATSTSAARAGTRAFIGLNCAALSESLLLTELFGHERGAFTGAVERKRGKFELADGGTLFLDEIGDMSLEVQAKLLRVIEEACFERLGGVKRISVDARIITATNKDLPQLIREGKFREDLFYRINVVFFHLPPLRERRGDIPLLVEHFLAKYSERYVREPVTLDPATMECPHRLRLAGKRPGAGEHGEPDRAARRSQLHRGAPVSCRVVVPRPPSRRAAADAERRGVPRARQGR